MKKPLDVLRAYPPHDYTLTGLLASRVAANGGKTLLVYEGQELAWRAFAQRVEAAARSATTAPITWCCCSRSRGWARSSSP